MQDNYSHKWRAFIGIALLSFGGYLDYTVVNIALPTIQQQLHANLATLQWVMNIYFLVLCVLATIMGRCGDIYGQRGIFYGGVGIFAVASLIAGLAGNIHWLIFGRFLQAIGGAIIFPIGLSLLPQCFPENERAKAIGGLGSLGGLALALGPVLGGFIVTYWGWRWIFFINIPMIIVGYLFCIGAVKKIAPLVEKQSIDWVGTILLALTVGGIVLSLIHSEALGWSNTLTLSYLAMGIIAGIFLVPIELRKADPLVDFKDFKNLLFYAGACLCLLAGVLSAVALFFDPLYLQVIRGETVHTAGLVLFAIPLAVFIIAFMVSTLTQKFGLIPTILIGLFLGALAGLLQIFFTPTSALIYIIIAFVILGAQWGMGNTVSIIAAQTAVAPHRASVATGTMVTMFNLGGSISLALAVVIYHAVGLQTIATLSDVTQFTLLKKLIVAPAEALSMQLNPILQSLFNHSFMQGFAGVMWFLFTIASLLFLSVLGWNLLKRK